MKLFGYMVYMVYIYIQLNETTMKPTVAQTQAIANFFERNTSFKSDMILGWMDSSCTLVVVWDDFKCLLVISKSGDIDSRIL